MDMIKEPIEKIFNVMLQKSNVDLDLKIYETYYVYIYILKLDLS